MMVYGFDMDSVSDFIFFSLYTTFKNGIFCVLISVNERFYLDLGKEEITAQFLMVILFIKRILKYCKADNIL